MPLGIRPIVDFAFKKTFGTPENRVCLVSLLNAVLRPKEPIVDVTLDNPFNPRDFQEDKLSQLDIKAIDRTGAIYNVEVQLYEPGALLELLPQPAIQRATETLARIAEITADKAMYDAREKAIRDRKWELDARFREGQIDGEIRMVRTLQGLLGVAVAEEQELHKLTLEQLRAMTSELQEKLRNR